MKALIIINRLFMVQCFFPFIHSSLTTPHSPANIFGTGVHHVGPEGPAVAGVGVEDAERVQEALLKQLTEALPLLVRVARRLVPVAGRVL